MTEFKFSTTLVTHITVNARNVEQAMKKIRAALEDTEANLGAWPNGDPIVCPAYIESIDEDDLLEINGEAA